MGEESDWERRRQLGWDESTALEVREELLRDPDPRVRAAAAQHASPDQLRVLASDPRAEVRSAVAANENTPTAVLLTLTEDRSANVRWWVVAGAQLQRNKEVLRRLRGDGDRVVASTARAALDSMHLYRRMLALPGSGLASLAHRLIQKRRRG
jgi:hypothetical protein